MGQSSIGDAFGKGDIAISPLTKALLVDAKDNYMCNNTGVAVSVAFGESAVESVFTMGFFR
jgi:hypothetical protein